MPRRDDLHKILIIGSGPIVIGQACEFDYSGTQACKVLLDEGYEVVLVNSNPATIMTDPAFATRTYIEPLDLATLTRIIEVERPDALLPTLGGQTALNLAMELKSAGVLDLWEVEMIGADEEAIHRAEDRLEFRTAMDEIGLRTPRSALAADHGGGRAAREELGLPLVVRPAYTLGGSGGGIAYDAESFRRICEQGPARSAPSRRCCSRSPWSAGTSSSSRSCATTADNVVIICSIENIDPMGVHTGDSVTVAPALTLTDPQYQELRDAAKAIIRKIGVDTGGSNVQFAVNPETGEVVVIEMNPRVSRSSALASKATGFPIAKIAARLAVGYTLDEIDNDITRKTPACFEPTLDYVVVKMPRWAFEKFPHGRPRAHHAHEERGGGHGHRPHLQGGVPEGHALARARRAGGAAGAAAGPAQGARRSPRPSATSSCCRRSAKAWASTRCTSSPASRRSSSASSATSWSSRARCARRRDLTPELLRRMKRYGFSDKRLGELTGRGEREVRALRIEHDVLPVYKAVDTCAAEFEAETPYFYSTYEEENEAAPGERERVVILGSGPNRIGQGIEFDYCCVHAALTAREQGYEAVMVNCNPETVSTDYDISDRLYFEPLTFEDVANIVANERPKGVIVQFGGQTPLKIARQLAEAGIPILGTPQESIDLAEDRGRFGALLDELGIRCPEYGLATTVEEAAEVAARVGYPLLVRPSYVLGGRAMQIVYGPAELEHYMKTAVSVSARRPVLIDKFLEDAIEVDVDAVCDGEDVYVGAVMQHVEEAGVHSGDSACVIPSISLGEGTLEQVRKQTRAAGPRARRQGPHERAVRLPELPALRARGEPARLAHRALRQQGHRRAARAARHARHPRRAARATWASPRRVPDYVSVKEAVLPFSRFPGTDTQLGPEMKSTGEVMGIAADLPGGVRQGRGRRRHAAAHRGQRVPLGVRHGQVGGHHPGAAPALARVHHLRHARHRHGAHQPRHPGATW